jgi:hypothetical protein
MRWMRIFIKKYAIREKIRSDQTVRKILQILQNQNVAINKHKNIDDEIRYNFMQLLCIYLKNNIFRFFFHQKLLLTRKLFN